MKLKILSLLLIIITLLAGCSWSQEEKIAVMDMERVLQESKEASKLQQELLQVGEDLEQEYKQKQQELEGAEGDAELDKIYQEYLNNKLRLETKLNQAINKILKELSEEEHYGIVVTKDQVHYGGIDITDEVIARLDTKDTGDGEQTADQ